ncbi:SUPT4H1 [Symbiodinium microadriaticum]|nr:SUPT4H1 [Symbiodinium microadriaticum]
MRCCLRCSLLKTVDQFYESGCENCEFLHLSGNQSRINNCTSAYFAGMIALLEPHGSWVARWQKIENAVPGLYAVEVVGELPQDVIEYCEDNNYSYRSQKKR